MLTPVYIGEVRALPPAGPTLDDVDEDEPLDDEPEPMPEIDAPRKNAPPRSDQSAVLEKRIIKLLREDQPLKAHEIATKLSLPLKPVQAILEDDKFEYSVDGYWLANELS